MNTMMRLGFCGLVGAVAMVAASDTHAALLSDNFNSYANQQAFEGTAPASNGMSTGGAYSNQYTSNNRWGLSTSGGISNSGRISPSVGQNTIAVNNTSFAGFGAAPELAVSVKTFITTRSSVDQYAFSAFRTFLKTDTSTSEASSLNFAFNYVYTAGETGTAMRFNVLANGTTLDTLSGFTTSGKWYQWDATWTLVGDTFDLALTLSDLGTDGLQTPTVVDSWTRTGIDVAAVKNASSLYAGVGGKYRSNIGTARIDDLTVAVVPEPSAIALLSLAALPLLRRRRV